MTKNFRIHIKGMQGNELSCLSDSIFNFMWESTHKKFYYGYLPTKMTDVLTTECEFTYCHNGKKGLNKTEAIMIKSFVAGWFANHHSTIYHFEWVTI